MTCRVIVLSLLLAALSFSQTPARQRKLPDCPHAPNSIWDHCTGTRSEANGNVYIGEFRENKFDGQGTLTYANKSQYVGEFRDGKFSGQGTFTHSNGSQDIGEFRDGQFVKWQTKKRFHNGKG